jgi:hypothetical protein
MTAGQRSLGLTTLLVVAPRGVLACPVCFGQSDSPMAWAMNMGIFVMLLIVGGVLAGFASFIVHLVRRAQLAEAGFPAGAGDFDRAGERGPATNAQGDTASC